MCDHYYNYSKFLLNLFCLLGEQCSFCIGFSDAAGLPVAGIVYRPITSPPTFAAGAKSENYIEANLDMAAVPNPRGLLTSNGGISPFIAQLITELGYERVPSGGAGSDFNGLIGSMFTCGCGQATRC